MGETLSALSLSHLARAKIATVGLALLVALIALVAGARILLIEAAVPPALLLDSFRVLNPDLRQRPSISERTVAYVNALLSDPSLAHARFATCADETARARAAKTTDSLAASWTACLDAVDDALAASPSSAGLWLERAKLVNAVNGSGEEVFQALRKSYQLGAREGWLMVRRISFLALTWHFLPEDLQNQAPAELDTILSSWPLTEDLGRIFLRDSHVRTNIVKLIETIGPEAKRRFLWALNALAFEPGWPLPSAEIAIIAGGEAYQGPPAFRLWADDIIIAEVDVKAAIDTTSVDPVTPQMISTAMRNYFVTIPNIETVKSIAIEFFNDAWAGEGKRGDRNLWIKEISLNGRRYSALELVPETNTPELAPIVDGFAVLAAVGRFRIDRPGGGWSEAP